VLKLEVQESPLVTIVRCSGRIVYGDGADALAKAVMSKDTRYFLIDLIGVNAIDAAGLGALAALERWARNENRTIHLANLSKRVREAVETTRLSSVLQIFLISESTQPRAIATARRTCPIAAHRKNTAPTTPRLEERALQLHDLQHF
jgi:anti-sigma B factor antagonist